MLKFVRLCTLLLALLLAACAPSAHEQSDILTAIATGLPSAASFVTVDAKAARCDHDLIGNMIAKGKVHNESRADLGRVELRATVYDKAGAIVNTNTSYIASDELAAGASSTYSIYIDDPSEDGVKCVVTVEDAEYKD